MQSNIVIVDDSRTQLLLLETLLRQHQYTPKAFVSPVKALEYMKSHKVDILISDYSMPELNGLELINEARQTNPFMIKAVVSAYIDEVSTLKEDCEILSTTLLRKPFDLHDFKGFINSLGRENKTYCLKFPNQYCILRDKVASGSCLVCCLDDKEDDKAIIQDTVDTIDDYLLGGVDLTKVSSKFSYMTNALSSTNYLDYSNICSIVTQIPSILYQNKERIYSDDILYEMIQSYLGLIKNWMYNTLILEESYTISNLSESIEADFQSIQYALGLISYEVEDDGSLDDLFF